VESKPRYSLETIQANAPPGVDPWLSPAAVSEIIGVDKKWLANAREGRKNIQGPPYIKLGEGRTAPIRYRLSSVIAWMASFDEHGSTMHRAATPHRSFAQFMDKASGTDRWLFVVGPDGRSATDVFEALKWGALMSNVKLQWLTRANYINQRFIKAKLQLDADTMTQLLAIGDGDLSAGVANLISLASRSTK
jgi:hypothetical protein